MFALKLLWDGDEHRIQVKYDGRFGFDAYCTMAVWICAPERHGEHFHFSFPNGKTVSVIRHACWNYELVELSTMASMGFAQGLYEVAILSCNPNQKHLEGGDFVEEPEGFLDHTQVAQVLERVKNME